jgi:hypothetical protein
MNDMTDPRSEALEWSRMLADARAVRAKKARNAQKRARMKAARAERRTTKRTLWLGRATVAGMHTDTGLWLSRVEGRDHLTLRAYGITSAAGVFAAVALDRKAAERLHHRLGNLLAQWKP